MQCISNLNLIFSFNSTNFVDLLYACLFSVSHFFGSVVPHDSASKESRRKMAEAYSMNQKLNGKVSEEDLKQLRRKLEEDSDDTKQEVKTKRMRQKSIC